jgi:hypothetical protein
LNRAAAIVALLLAAAAPPNDHRPRVSAITARLFYTNTGSLSANVLDTKGYFGNWNTIIGGGSVSGPADDVLIVVAVDQDRAAGQQANVSLPLRLTATHKGNVLASRTIKDILIPDKGPAYAGLWLNGVGCAGSIDVVAQIGSSKKKATLDLDCGE